MFFKNATIFRFPAWLPLQTKPDPMDPDRLTLHSALEACAARPVGPSELMSRGFVPPMGGESEALFHERGEAAWITLGGESRILPASAVNAALSRKVRAIEKAEGRRIGGRARRRLKEDLVAEMLPRALVKPYRLNAYLDLERGLLVVDTAGRRAAENLVSELRHALGSFPALPLNAETSPRAIMTGWLRGEHLADGLALGEEFELRDPVDGGGVARFSRQEWDAFQVGPHIEAGKQCVRVGLVFRDRISFTIGEDLVLRKIRFLDGALDSLEGQERDGVAAELDARFFLMTREFRELFDALERVFTITKPEG